MIKSIFVILLVAGLLWLARTTVKRLQQSRPEAARVVSHDTVKCQYCEAYIPASDALQSAGKSFCNQQHLNAWKQSV